MHLFAPTHSLLSVCLELHTIHVDHIVSVWNCNNSLHLLVLMQSNFHSLCRPEAVALVDASGILDEVLGSALGRYDGNVYRHLYQWAKKSSLSKHEVSYTHPHLQAFIAIHVHLFHLPNSSCILIY